MVSWLLLYSIVAAQSGSDFAITQSILASGGGKSSDTANNVFTVSGTAGQAVAGTRSSASGYTLSGGFWASTTPPTAAGVSVSGRVLISAAGRGLVNASVVLTDQAGVTRRVPTGRFGYYRFDDVQSGQTYIITIASRRYQFEPQVINVTDNLTNIDFIGHN